jgi:hyperosmotically inducible periplasmic protein
MQFRTSVKRQLSSSVFATLVLSSSVLLAVPCFGQDQATPATAPDNSAQNKHQTSTAEQQSSATSDRQLTAKIRRSLIADKSLSMDAHNVKIITMNGAVTLKGPVKSDEEKQEIAAKAAEIAGGPDKITNQLTVKGQS